MVQESMQHEETDWQPRKLGPPAQEMLPMQKVASSEVTQTASGFPWDSDYTARERTLALITDVTRWDEFYTAHSATTMNEN
jgi:hypothetical protein